MYCSPRGNTSRFLWPFQVGHQTVCKKQNYSTMAYYVFHSKLYLYAETHACFRRGRLCRPRRKRPFSTIKRRTDGIFWPFCHFVCPPNRRQGYLQIFSLQKSDASVVSQWRLNFTIHYIAVTFHLSFHSFYISKYFLIWTQALLTWHIGMCTVYHMVCPFILELSFIQVVSLFVHQFIFTF